MPKFIVQLKAVALVQGGVVIEAENGEEAMKLAEKSPLVLWSCPTQQREIHAYRSFSAVDGSGVIEK